MPGYLHPVQAAFLALLPLTVLDFFGTVAANFLGERRAQRGMAPAARVNFLFLAAGWTLTSAACGLLAWAAGAWATGPGGGQHWIAAGLIWGMVISACAALMLIGRAIPAVTGSRPAWLATGVGAVGGARRSGGGVAGAGPVGGLGLTAGVAGVAAGVGVTSDVFGIGGLSGVHGGHAG